MLENGTIDHNVYRNQYFGIGYPIPPDWVQKYTGPTPSDTSSYVLTELSRLESYPGTRRDNILITAQGLFFTTLPVVNAPQLVNCTEARLQSDYQLEPGPVQLSTGGRSFANSAYWSPVAELHWYVLATEIPCHAVEFVVMNRDLATLVSIVQQTSSLKLSKESSATEGTDGDGAPLCIKNYAAREALSRRLTWCSASRDLIPFRFGS